MHAKDVLVDPLESFPVAVFVHGDGLLHLHEGLPCCDSRSYRILQGTERA